MIRLGAIGAIALLMAIPAAAAQSAVHDSQRVEMIARAKASVVHVRAPVVRDQARRSADAPKDQHFADFIDNIRGRLGESKPSEASGFVIDSQRGLILTAAHVVARAQSLHVAFSEGGPERVASLAGIDEEAGIALLRVAGPMPPALALSPRETRAGETAMVVGWMLPLKSVLALEGMITGAVPGAASISSTAPVFVDYVAVDIAIPNGGFGGAPVLDQRGDVVGMVSAIFGRDYGPGSLTLMIPIHQIAPLVEELATRGYVSRSRIGVSYDCEANPCTVTAVDAGSGAAAAGVSTGDRILAVDGVAINGDVALRRAVARKPAGSDMILRIERHGRAIDLRVRTDPGR